jgi:hypothetical protein
VPHELARDGERQKCQECTLLGWGHDSEIENS